MSFCKVMFLLFHMLATLLAWHLPTVIPRWFVFEQTRDIPLNAIPYSYFSFSNFWFMSHYDRNHIPASQPSIDGASKRIGSTLVRVQLSQPTRICWLISSQFILIDPAPSLSLSLSLLPHHHLLTVPPVDISANLCLWKVHFGMLLLEFFQNTMITSRLVTVHWHYYI